MKTIFQYYYFDTLIFKLSVKLKYPKQEMKKVAQMVVDKNKHAQNIVTL